MHGGIMAVTSVGENPYRSPDHLCRLLLRECILHRPRGLLLDIDSPTQTYADLAAQLGHLLPRQNITLFLPESLANCAPGCRVLIPSALSGGSLDHRLTDAVQHFGLDRVVLAVQQIAEDLRLPAPDGCGLPLSSEELSSLMESYCPSTHFSPPLCTRYFTYCRGSEIHLVLYDDVESLQKKLACARRCGVSRFLLPWQDISHSPGDFLSQ